ncbi:MAG: DNA replication and repair protein RecF [Bacteroidales bacterium]|nr:DNA replication and repair protein RecF [Bacteroidales bacterium]
MYLSRISLTNFKNFKEISIGFSPKLNCITGMNGAGKTNLLDSIYYLSMTKSYLSNQDQFTISHNEQVAYISGEYKREDNSSEQIALSISRLGEKQIKRNGKGYKRLSDHIGIIPIVMVSPYDTCLINESGEERRKFLNAIISQLDREYLRRVQNYNQLLAQRNRLLKMASINTLLLEAISEKMQENAIYIFNKRSEFVKDFVPHVLRYYKDISGGKETVTIEYRSDLERGELTDILREAFSKESHLGYTTAGIHRDELLFKMDGEQIRKVGSQGQQKSFLISLKLAQYSLFREISNLNPLLLLDDVFDKLDMTRVEYLLNLVSSDGFGQIFITDSNKVRIEGVLSEIGNNSTSIEIEGGVVL